MVAYNHANEPSNPVCSDGITVDLTAPIVHDIRIQDAYTHPKLIEWNNATYYISNERKAYIVNDVPYSCM